MGFGENRKGFSMRSMTWLLVVAALFVTPGTLFAGGGNKGDWELGIYGGYAWLDDYGFLNPEDSFLAGARLGYFFTHNWSLEASAQRIFSKTEMHLLGVPDVDADLDAARLNLLYNFSPCHKLRPFLTAGVGYEGINTDGYGESCDFGWNVGGGLRFFLSDHVNLRADGRYVGIKVGDPIDESEGNVEASLGLSYLFGGAECGEETKVEEQIEATNQAPTVSCSAERMEILPGEVVTLTATATDPEGDPVTYEWTSTCGQVSGTGSSASFQFSGSNPPASCTATVRASDDHGHTATCDVTVTRGQAAPPQAQAVSCTSSGFPRNLSRLNNVDKACLDDVASRLSADPRAKVVVIGYADPGETSPNTIAKKRADAVEDYLEGRGIESSRITTKSGGTSGTGRRVEVWFVPEGAAEPK
jgi:outer membrane protein OmpA-like peptidoglycan-associated protein/opacity protein-like surface antigen